MERNLLGEDDAEPSWCEWMNVVLYFWMRIFLNVCRFFPDGYRPVLVSHRGRGMADVERIRGVRVSLTQTFRSRFARRFVSVRKGSRSRLLSNLQAMFDRLDLPSFEKTVELRASKSVAAIIDDITPRSFKILRLDTVCPTDSWASLASWSSVPSPEEEFAWFDCRDGRDYPIGFWSEERKFFARSEWCRGNRIIRCELRTIGRQLPFS